MAPTNAKTFDEIIPEGHSTIALGATTLKVLNTTSIWSNGCVFDDRLSLKYFELKYDGLHYI
jgi:hypothetical protein